MPPKIARLRRGCIAHSLIPCYLRSAVKPYNVASGLIDVERVFDDDPRAVSRRLCSAGRHERLCHLYWVVDALDLTKQCAGLRVVNS